MCGIIGFVCRGGQAAPVLRAGGHKLLHRSHNSGGAATYDVDTGKYHVVRGVAELPRILSKETLDSLKGRIGIAHVRWATVGALNEANIHPLEGHFQGKRFLLVHNGEISSRRRLERQFAEYQPEVSSDSKFFAALIEHSRAETFEDALREVLPQVQGTYSLLILFEDALYAARDPSGNRPLFIGKKDDAVCIASEDVAFRVLGIEQFTAQEVEPGTMLRVRAGDLDIKTQRISPENVTAKFCIIEGLYCMHRPSTLFGRTVEKIRWQAGWKLAQRYRPSADIVVGIPDSGVPASKGFSAGSGIAYEEGIIRYHQSGRIFYGGIEERPDLYRFKYDPVVEVLKGRRVVLGDDTLFEGSTAQNVIKICVEAGVQEIHLAIFAPMIVQECYYGTPTSTNHRRLLARDFQADTERMLQEISGPFNEIVKSIAFLTLEETEQAIVDTVPFRENAPQITTENFCDACFLGGKRHIPVDVD